MQTRDLSVINQIVIHHSESEWGNVDAIDDWHKARGFEMCGYHSVICNCYPTAHMYTRGLPDINNDGKEEEGRKPYLLGAGARGHNTNSIHICLIGNKNFTSAQLVTLRTIVEYYRGFIPSITKVVRHCDLDEKKPNCPGLSDKFIRELLA